MDGISRELSLLQKWSGDYPVFQLSRLPEGQYMNRVGFIENAVTFNQIWQAFKPGEEVPAIDFNADIVVYTRNVDFYNPLSIVKVLLTDGIAEIVSKETMSARPIGDQVAMALAVIPRPQVRFIQLSSKLLAVPQR